MSAWRRYLRFWRPDIDADIDDELRFHLESLLFEVSVHDTRIFVGAPALLVLVAVVATCVPAVRAARVDPMSALRIE